MRFLAVIVTLLFLIVGGKLCLTGDKMYDEAQIFPTVERIDYGKFAEERPLVGWYQISGGIVDLAEGAYRSSQVNTGAESRPTADDLALLSRAKEIYVPVHDETAPAKPADIILFTRDADLVGAVKAMSLAADTSQHATAPRIINGMVRAPSELPDRIRRVLGDSINTQSIIIEEYATPSTARAIETMVSGGAMVLAVAVMWLLIWRLDRKRIVVPEEFMTDDGNFEDDI